MKNHTYAKCSASGRVLPLHKLTTCDHCLRKFSDEYIYVGIDIGEYHLKNICEECLNILDINPDNYNKSIKDESNDKRKIKSDDDALDTENGQINISMLEKKKENYRNGHKMRNTNKFIEEHFINTQKVNKSPEETINRWEYKSVFLAIDSDVEIDEQILSHIQRDYLNIFPVNKGGDGINDTEEDSTKFDNQNIINIDKLNKLGDEGWEVITSIPKTKSIMLLRKNGRPASTFSANVSGAYIILKRKKISKPDSKADSLQSDNKNANLNN
ncbi:MAG: hypothetical protein ACOCV8_03090 [Spirochaetota bacterium]